MSMRNASVAGIGTALILGASPMPAEALVIMAMYDAGFNAADKLVIDDAIAEWEARFSRSNHKITVNFVIDNNLGDLGLTHGWNPDANGIPTNPTVTIDYNDHNWTLGAPAAGMNDALDTLKHEVGHAIGWTVLLPRFNANVLTIMGNRFYDLNMNGAFDPGDFDLDDGGGTHAVPGSGDLMAPTTPLGQRHHPTHLHALVLQKAFGYVPEPATLLLMLGGLLGFGRFVRRPLSP